MKIYHYWLKKKVRLTDEPCLDAVVYGKSNLSEEDALKDLMETAKMIRSRILNGERFIKSEDYVAPIREELLEEISPGNIITRNYYGAEILNTETIIFADVDHKCFKRRYVPGFFGRLFGKKEESEAEYQDRVQTSVINSIKQEWIEKSHIRVYRTHSGYRVLFAGLQIQPGSRECYDLLCYMNSDILYNLLCRKQQCCRARLTPKPGRIKQRSLRLRYPFEAEQTEKINEWIQEYNQKSAQFAVCKLIATYGRNPDVEEQKIIAYHDEKCRAKERLPLA